MVVVAAAKPHVGAIVRRHNAVLQAAYARIDGSLEEKLAALVQPILEQAGNKAAARFQKNATNHLTAAVLRLQDRQALARIEPGVADDGFFGFRLRPLTLTASAPTPNSAMICVKPRADEAAEIAWAGGETAESLHVTLAYLGPVDGSLQDIADALAPVAASHAPLSGVVGGVGRFQPPGVAILLPDVPGLVELRVAITEALADTGIYYGREHGFEAHISIEAEPDPDTLEEALARTAQKPLHFDSVLIVVGDEIAVELPLIGPQPATASGFSLTAAGEHVGWTPPAGDELLNVDDLVKTLRTKTDPVRLAVLKTSMDPALKDAGLSFDVTNPLTAKVLAQAGSQVKGIAQTTQLNVMRIIDRSYNAGLSIPDTAKAIRAGMASASASRARTIARTELAGAANGGSLAATMLASDSLGIGFYKQWLTAPGAPHPRHEDYDGLDGQTVTLEEPFDVGGEPLQFPGDPDGSPEETINCRCALAYTETPPEGIGAGVDTSGGVTDGVSSEGEAALQDAMPLTAPAGDTVSVNVAPFVPTPIVERIKALGIDKPLKDVRPTTDVGREVFANGPTTEDLYKVGGEWTPERKQLHADIIAKHFEGKVVPAAGSPKTAIFTSGGGASGKGATMIDIGDRHFPLSELEDHPERFPDVVLMNTDIIKAMLPEYEELRNAGDLYAASGVHEESSAVGKIVADMAERQGYNIVIDTTGSSSSFVGKLEQAVKDGYEVKVRMVSIPTNEAVVRAMARGDRSGRYVAIDPLKGAHRGASAQLAIWKDMKSLDWQVYDNTDTRILVAEKKAGQAEFTVHDQKKWDEILGKANETSAAPNTARAAEATPPPRTVADLVPGPSTATLDHVDSFQQPRLDDWAAKYPVGQFGNSVNEIRQGYLAAVDDVIAKAVADAAIKIRVPSDVLGKLLDEGRFKSQFETQRSGGLLDATERARSEETMFGYSPNLNPELRPIYGYLDGSASESGAVNQYGEHTVVLKDSARERSTFTLTDSLGAGGMRGEIVPVALTDPVEAHRAYMTTRFDGNVDPLDYAPGGRYLLEQEPLKGLSETYAEAQIHGGVTLEDVAEVTISRDEISRDLEGLRGTVSYYEQSISDLEQKLAESNQAESLRQLDEDRLAGMRATVAAMRLDLAEAERHSIDAMTAAFEARGIKVKFYGEAAY